MNCEQVQQDIAIALLGKGELDAGTQSHVANCPACAAEQAMLRPVVSLLPQLQLTDLEAAATTVEADDALLERLLLRAAVERSRQRRRSRTSLGTAFALAASAAVLALASVAGLFAPAEHSVVASASAGGIDATANIEPADRGSVLTIQIAGVARGTSCRLQVIGTNGERETIVTWVADYRGTATTHGTSTLLPSQIKQVTVREVGGPILLTIPVQA